MHATARNRENGLVGGKSSTGSAAWLVTADPEYVSKLRLNILVAQLFRARPSNDHEVLGRLQLVSM